MQPLLARHRRREHYRHIEKGGPRRDEAEERAAQKPDGLAGHPKGPGLARGAHPWIPYLLRSCHHVRACPCRGGDFACAHDRRG